MVYIRSRNRSSEESARLWAAALFYGIVTLGLCTLWYLYTVLLLRPYFVCLNSTVFISLYHYLTRANSFWHQSQQLENQFWMTVTFVSCCTLVFAPDSPYYASTGFTQGLGWIFVFSSTTAAHFLDKRHHRSKLQNIPEFFAYPVEESSTAEGKVEMLSALASQLDRTLPSTFHTLWNISQYVKIERQILSILSDCSREELNYVVVKVEMKLIAYKLKNHNRTTNSSLDLTNVTNLYSRTNRSRSRLMDILAVQRVSDLNLPARVIVLDIIQSLRLTIHPDTESEAQAWVKNLLVTVKGDDLSELKQMVDNKGSAESMHKLLHEDIRDDQIRMEIIDHFKNQAKIQAAQMSMGNKLARKRLMKGAWRKILSDVDDTLFSSGGRYPAGIDQSYKRKTFYPAVTAFYKELDLGIVGPDAQRGVFPKTRFGNLVFLSARPHVYKDLTETGMYAKFRRFMKTQNLHCMPSLLPGDLESGQAFMMKGDFLPMALKKFRNFEQYYSIYPEYTHVFIGDNGQADVKAAEYMVERFGREVVERVYIHQVQQQRFTYGYEPGISEMKWKKLGIVFCKTYVAAALDAATYDPKKPLILMEGLQRVVLAARNEFLKIRTTWKDVYERDTRRVELNNDIALANIKLVENGFCPIHPIEGEPVFKIGSVVYTGFGVGYVSQYRPSDGMYEIVLNWKCGSCRPPKLYTLLHGIHATLRELKNAQKMLFSAREEENNRYRSSTFESANDLLPHYDSAPPSVSETGSTRTPTPPPRRTSFINSATRTLAEQEKNNAMRKSILDRRPTSASLPNIDLEDDVQSVREVASPRLVPSTVSYFPFGFITPAITYTGAETPHHFHHQSLAGLSKADADILDVGTSVNTPYEKGVVLGFRRSDHIYELALPKIGAKGYVAEVSLILWNSKLFEQRADEMVREGSYPSRLFGVMRNLFKRENIIAPETVVKTPYGQAKVVTYRKQDEMYQVNFVWKGTGYLQKAVVKLDSEFLNALDEEEVTDIVKNESSPLQRARDLVVKNWALFKLPFSVMGGGSLAPHGSMNALPTSESLLSLSSLVSATSSASNSSFFSLAEDRFGEIWTLKEGDRLDTNGFGVGVIRKIRPDGFYVVQLPYGEAYINVPRILDPTQVLEYPCRVWTEYGLGIVLKYRPQDQIYAIQMERWGAVAYIYATRRPPFRSLQKSSSAIFENEIDISNEEEITPPNSANSDSSSTGKSSFRSSILSFISHIIQPGSKPDETAFNEPIKEEEDEEVRKTLPDTVFGHTTYSWIHTDESALVGGNYPPVGHTSFSWDGMPVDDDIQVPPSNDENDEIQEMQKHPGEQQQDQDQHDGHVEEVVNSTEKELNLDFKL